jgi:hypothetical protein
LLVCIVTIILSLESRSDAPGKPGRGYTTCDRIEPSCCAVLCMLRCSREHHEWLGDGGARSVALLVLGAEGDFNVVLALLGVRVDRLVGPNALELLLVDLAITPVNAPRVLLLLVLVARAVVADHSNLTTRVRTAGVGVSK